jgi:hypothetical protein
MVGPYLISTSSLIVRHQMGCAQLFTVYSPQVLRRQANNRTLMDRRRAAGRAGGDIIIKAITCCAWLMTEHIRRRQN